MRKIEPLEIQTLDMISGKTFAIANLSEYNRFLDIIAKKQFSERYRHLLYDNVMFFRTKSQLLSRKAQNKALHFVKCELEKLGFIFEKKTIFPTTNPKRKAIIYSFFDSKNNRFGLSFGYNGWDKTKGCYLSWYVRGEELPIYYELLK
jgi:hypothetical protein